MSTLELNVRAEYTPNPNSLKFICSETILKLNGSLTYSSKKEAANSLALKLFAIEGIEKVFIMSNFVTVDKKEAINWKDIHLDIKNTIKAELDNFRSWAEANSDKFSSASGEIDGDTKSRIEAVLDKIRPALVADGGNIELVDVIDKDARLRMVGACGTCPSSLMTMKMGVERALLAEVPDLVETVTQVY